MVSVLYNTRTLKRRVKREPLSLMNERLIWSLPTSTNILYKERGGRQRGGGKERAVPTSTVGLELSQSPRLNILSAWSSFLMWNRPREGGRPRDKTRQWCGGRDGQKATLGHRVIPWILEKLFTFLSYVRIPSISSNS